MRKKLTSEQAEVVHADLIRGQAWSGVDALYQYLCSKHGPYPQRFSAHKRGAGCPKCANERWSEKKSFTIGKAEALHADLVKNQVWSGARSKYKYLCPVHGEYQQSFAAHGLGRGCQKCGRNIVEESVRLTPEEVEARHPDLRKGQVWSGVFAEYIYLCDIHGEYLQSFDSHDQGAGCQICNESRLEKSVNALLNSMDLGNEAPQTITAGEGTGI